MTDHRIIHGDVMKGIRLIPDASVHEVITSIPYLWQRDYGEAGQIGLEETPQDYVKIMVDVSREIFRILRPDGVYFMNTGDSYVGSGKGPTGLNGIGDQGARQGFTDRKAKIPAGMKPKDLVGIPWALAEALRADGWYWRKWFPWIKRNCLPESINDRPGSSLEVIHMFAKSGNTLYWTHPVHNAVRVQPEPDYIWTNRDTGEITKIEPENWRNIRWDADPRKRLWARTNLWEGRDYFWDPDAIRVTQSLNTHSRGTGSVKKLGAEDSTIRAKGSWNQSTLNIEVPGGRNRRDSDWFFESWDDLAFKNAFNAWQGLVLDEDGDPIALVVNPQPFEGDHFAVFPETLVEPLVLAGTSEKGCCPACGAPYIRIIEKGEPLEDWKRECGADSQGEYNGISWKHDKLLTGKTGHFHDKEKRENPPQHKNLLYDGQQPQGMHLKRALKQDALGDPRLVGFNARCQQNASDVKRRILAGMKERITKWVPSCDCNAGEPVPCTVFDPFLGRGTTIKVSRDLGRSSAGCELSSKYIEKTMKKFLGVNQKELDTGTTKATYHFLEAPA